LVPEARALHLLEQPAQAAAGPIAAPAPDRVPPPPSTWPRIAEATATASGPRPASAIREHREHHGQQRHHDVGPAAAGRGRTLSRTPPSLLLSGAPAQHTAEQFVAKSYDVALPGVSGCALDL
jgi:hypothetical protein